MKGSIFFLIGLLVGVSGCSATRPVVAYDQLWRETYRGTVNMSFVDGTGSIDVMGEKTHTRAVGVALWQYGSGATRGGIANIQSTDGRRIRAEWMAMRMDAGYGSGTDQSGNEFIFGFGLTPVEEAEFIKTQGAGHRAGASLFGQ